MKPIKSTMWLTENRDDSYRGTGFDFKIKKIKNSTRFMSGDFISESDVRSLIRARWDIIIEERK